MIDVDGNRNGRAAIRQEQPEQRFGKKRDGKDERPRHQHVYTDTRQCDLANPVPFARADILRRHRANRSTDRDGGHLRIAPKLVHHAKGRRRVDTLAVHQTQHRQRRSRHDDHRQPHRHAHFDDRCQISRVWPQIGQFFAAQPDGQVFGVNPLDQDRDTDHAGDQRRQCRTRYAHRRDRTPAQNEDGIENDIDHHIQYRVPQWRHRIAHTAQ